MDANRKQENEISALAGKAVAEAMISKKQMEHAQRVFEDSTEIDQVLGYLAGASSVCWTKPPKGEFRSEMAQSLVECAHNKINQLVLESATRHLALIQKNSNSVPFNDAILDYSITGEDTSDVEAEHELASRYVREGDHQ